MSAQLLMSRLVVRSFRCLDNVVVDLEPGTTVLVGENNSGKSSLLLALHTALGPRRASTDDLRMSADGTVAKAAVIDVFLSPPPGSDRFSDELRQRLVSPQRDPNTNRDMVGIRTTLQPSGEGSLLATRRTFLQPSADGAWIDSPAPNLNPKVLELLEAHLLDASRDLMSEMANVTSSWGRVLSDLKIGDRPDRDDGSPDPLSRSAIEEALRRLSQQVREASPVLTQLHSDLDIIARTQATVGSVDLVPLPMRIEELARTIEVILFQEDSAALPLRFHGIGSRSLAALLVFRTMCELKVGMDQGVRPHLVTLLEEPEAHLHPPAVAALLPTIDGLRGQRIVATHSTTLVAEVPPTSIRLLRRTPSGVMITALTKPANAQHFERLRRFFGRPFGEAFFARLVVIGDGVTERNALPVLISMALNADSAGLGVTFVDSHGMNDYQQLNPVLDALHQLGIPWLCFGDNDDAGLRDLSRLRDPGTGDPLSPAHPRVIILHGTKQMEQLLIDAGYQQEVTEVARDFGHVAEDDEARLRFLTREKGWAAEVIALRARQAGKAAPPHLAGLVTAMCTCLGRPSPAAPKQHTPS